MSQQRRPGARVGTGTNSARGPAYGGGRGPSQNRGAYVGAGGMPPRRNDGPTAAYRRPRRKPGWMLALTDVTLIGACLLIFALFDHVLPRGSVSVAPPVLPAQTQAVSAQETLAPQVAAPVATAAPGDFSQKFADKFTNGEVVATDTGYASKNINVQLTKYEEDAITYYVQDIYVRSIDCLRTTLANNAYGKSNREGVMQMAVRSAAIGAINGDYYSMGVTGVVIRNGVIYSEVVDIDFPACVLFRDGTVALYDETNFNAAALEAAGAWQGWQFGPSMLNADGTAATSFADMTIATYNPRTAFGYYEPGHYCFLVVDGRQDGYSEGVTYSGLAKLGEKLGLTILYNLDGGQTAQMVFRNSMANQPVSGGRECSDIIYVADLDTGAGI